MQNFSALSRAELIGALLAPVVPADHPRADKVNDLESPYFGTAAAEAETSDALARKLGVARELLLRELQAQMSTQPVMQSPQALRDWLRLFAADAHPRSDSMPWLSWRDSARALLRPIID